MTADEGSPTDECHARIGLSRLVEPDDRAAVELVAAAGPGALWAAALRGTAAVERLVEASAVRRPPRLLRRIAAEPPSTAEVERDVTSAVALGARVVCPGDPDWPTPLDLLEPARPLCLWVRGAIELELATVRAVAVVGSRAATSYGTYVAGELGYGLAQQGWTVVSGGAYGIDGAAHRGALAADGLTIAVLACGIDIAYPRGHATLLERIAEQGVLVTEWPPGSSPYPHRFLSRNRLIAGLTTGTVVVEAAARSGARSTANCAAELGRQLMAVPGPVTSAMSVGCHEMLREGATCVRSAADVIEALAPMGEHLTEPQRGPDEPRDHLPPAQRRTLEAVPVHRARPAVGISREAGIPLDEVRRALGTLEVTGFVERHEGGYRLSAAERARRRRARRGRSSGGPSNGPGGEPPGG
ncbi:MAG: DNA-processing protein DprA [Frankiaceae bacterium]